MLTTHFSRAAIPSRCGLKSAIFFAFASDLFICGFFTASAFCTKWHVPPTHPAFIWNWLEIEFVLKGLSLPSALGLNKPRDM
jgi:hypothetical protein